MSFKLDFETEEIEGITITAHCAEGDVFVKNYECFGWYLYVKNEHPVYDDDGNRYENTDLYDYVLYRDKNLANIDTLRLLEDRFQATAARIDVRKEALVGVGEKLNPDYFDFLGDKPIDSVYKLSLGKAIVNTVLCFCVIGFFLWASSLSQMAKNGKAKENLEAQQECKKILNDARLLRNLD